jgi:hypothetical protein
MDPVIEQLQKSCDSLDEAIRFTDLKIYESINNSSIESKELIKNAVKVLDTHEYQMLQPYMVAVPAKDLYYGTLTVYGALEDSACVFECDLITYYNIVRLYKQGIKLGEVFEKNNHKLHDDKSIQKIIELHNSKQRITLLMNKIIDEANLIGK